MMESRIFLLLAILVTLTACQPSLSTRSTPVSPRGEVATQ
ncbi:hypothetical protein BH24DEI2_BH24DEI2_20260 [soil metagenome]